MLTNINRQLRIPLITLIGMSQFTAAACDGENASSAFLPKTSILSETTAYRLIEVSPNVLTYARHPRILVNEYEFFSLLHTVKTCFDGSQHDSEIVSSNVVNQTVSAKNPVNFNSSQSNTTNNQSVIFLHTDLLGSVIAETDLNGTVIKRTEYKPFGESSSGN